MPRALVVPFQLLPSVLYPSVMFRSLWPSGPSSAEYARISQPTELETGVEGCEKDELDEDLRPSNNASRCKFLSRFGIFAALSCIIVTSITLYALSKGRSTDSNHRGSPPPLRIFFKAHISDGVDCNPPIKIVKDEDDAQIVIWKNPNNDLSIFDGEKARKEKPWQLHAYWSLENEEYYQDLKKARLGLEAGDPKAFDLSISYRINSDFPIPYTYSFIDLRKKSLPFEERRQDKLIAAFISNCNPMNNRTDLLDQLMKLLPDQIDSFGACRNNANPTQVINQFNWNPSNGKEPAEPLELWNEKMLIISKYKFTIAFENANEPDYVTEKYYQALSAGSIPLTLGQTTESFKKFKPSPNAALNAADFETVEELANKIKRIGNDRSTFESMLEWKTKPYPEAFEQFVSWGKENEACRMAKWAQNEWQNPYAFETGRYESLRKRLNLPHNSTATTRTNSSSLNTS